MALHGPPGVPLGVWTWYVPDIESPETEPEYVMSVDPTVPKLIVLPATVPLIGMVPLNDESVIVPLSFDPDCVQFSVNVPVNAPL